MKRVKFLLGILTLFLFTGGYYIFRIYASGVEAPELKANPKYVLTEEEKGLLQEGDIIMRHGEGLISSMIAHINKGAPYRLSHCAFLTKGKKDWIVIHAVSGSLGAKDGMQTASLDRFTKESIDSSIVVIRYKGDAATRQRFIDQAKVYLEREIPFDNEFTLADTTTFFCSELIHQVFLQVLQEDIFASRLATDHPHYIHFDQFLDPQYFELILNHQGEKVTPYMHAVTQARPDTLPAHFNH
jgi:hypothetical protein